MGRPLYSHQIAAKVHNHDSEREPNTLSSGEGSTPTIDTTTGSSSYQSYGRERHQPRQESSADQFAPGSLQRTRRFQLPTSPDSLDLSVGPDVEENEEDSLPRTARAMSMTFDDEDLTILTQRILERDADNYRLYGHSSDMELSRQASEFRRAVAASEMSWFDGTAPLPIPEEGEGEGEGEYAEDKPDATTTSSGSLQYRVQNVLQESRHLRQEMMHTVGELRAALNAMGHNLTLLQ
ncbi:hypothetical protein D9757_007635 [Collybiopsis confluens]|uniref:Uncharacterized protein n=1 Tax=Collybiopsis confluens TaxID=2823264 RepID=A0A8H5M3G8_9AGAR|nr:hypothetical protein D9757_007635 [Collybiopsis confluens]